MKMKITTMRKSVNIGLSRKSGNLHLNLDYQPKKLICYRNSFRNVQLAWLIWIKSYQKMTLWKTYSKKIWSTHILSLTLSATVFPCQSFWKSLNRSLSRTKKQNAFTSLLKSICVFTNILNLCPILKTSGKNFFQRLNHYYGCCMLFTHPNKKWFKWFSNLTFLSSRFMKL